MTFAKHFPTIHRRAIWTKGGGGVNVDAQRRAGKESGGCNCNVKNLYVKGSIYEGSCGEMGKLIQCKQNNGSL
jgi:hypothetical protein